MIPSHPILTCDAVARLEKGLFKGDETKEWPAMQAAGAAIAKAVGRDFEEIGGFPRTARILLLAGKGHNGGDALIAAQALLIAFPASRVDVVFVLGDRALRPLTQRAYRELAQTASDRLAVLTASMVLGPYALCLDGVFGFQFRPPAAPAIAKFFGQINELPIRLRAAVDLPSAGLFHADFTYATGSMKAELLTEPTAGRVRYLDLGFFSGAEKGRDRVLSSALLTPLVGLRPPQNDKRAQGHLLVLGGSRSYPGAVLMAVLSALRSGVGLVTAFVPETLAPAYAARAPEAMWVGWPETPDGSLALEGRHLWEARVSRATACAIGPGLGREAETFALVTDLIAAAPFPVLLDADALQPEIVRARKGPLVLTPHAGEFARLARACSGGYSPAGRAPGKQKRAIAPVGLSDYCRKAQATVVLKGPITRVGDGAVVYHSFFGGPVLARGGSGDLLAGLVGGLLAQTPTNPLLAATRGAVWHGIAADLLARAEGQTAVQTTQLLDFLSPALRESANDA